MKTTVKTKTNLFPLIRLPLIQAHLQQETLLISLCDVIFQSCLLSLHGPFANPSTPY